MGRLSIIGMGPGPEGFLLPLGLERIREADIIVGAPRHTRPYEDPDKETFEIQNNLQESIRFIAEKSTTKDIAVLVSGDPCLYSYTSLLKRSLPDLQMEIVPGISSFQHLCADLGMDWNDAALVSFHGSKATEIVFKRLLDLCRILSKIIVFTDGENGPKEISSLLTNSGETAWLVHIGCKLGYPDVRIISMSLVECAETWNNTDQLCVMILEKQ